MPATVTLVESVGSGTLRAVDSIQLLGVDGIASGSEDYLTYPVRVVSTSGIITTYERWFRFEFGGTYTALASVRFWVPSLVLNPGWSLLWGVSDTFRSPTSSTSDIAVNVVPAVDPVVSNLDFIDGPDDLLSEDTHDATQWVVLQATVSQDALSQMSPSSVSYELDWLEY